MCRVEKYLGVEISIASVSSSRTVTAFFFEENGIIYLNKLCALESICCNKNDKLVSSNNTLKLVSRD